MVKKIAIVPAAGVGSRWGGYPKFILPCGEGEWMLDRTIRSFPAEVEKVYITYSPETLVEIVAHMRRSQFVLGDSAITLTENTSMELGLWGSVLAGIQHEADFYYFAMPDTYFPGEVFEEMGSDQLVFGTFYTDAPERFGVIRDGAIVDKVAGDPGTAWGVIGWNRKIRDLWLSRPFKDFPEALSVAMRGGYREVEMDYYFDFASWQEYVDFIIWKNGEGV